MTQSITTSIRLPSRLSRQLGRISQRQKKGKNGIIVEALMAYFRHVERDSLKEEARLQSILVSGQGTQEGFLWEENLDFDEWKNKP